MNKRIILVGPTASGKNFLRNKFIGRGFKSDISYTTRTPIREGEENGVDYQFISYKAFKDMIALDMFYEWVKYGDYYYGTGLKQWDTCDVFIMETDGVNIISEENRKNCFVIYLDTPEHERVRRMRIERKWKYSQIQDRIAVDKKKFEGFTNFDIKITNPDF